MVIRTSLALRVAALGVLSLALSGCYGWGYHHHPYVHPGPGYGHPGPGPGGPAPGYNH